MPLKSNRYNYKISGPDLRAVFFFAYGRPTLGPMGFRTIIEPCRIHRGGGIAPTKSGSVGEHPYLLEARPRVDGTPHDHRTVLHSSRRSAAPAYPCLLERTRIAIVRTASIGDRLSHPKARHHPETQQVAQVGADYPGQDADQQDLGAGDEKGQTGQHAKH